jgi:hypothetical protein
LHRWFTSTMVARHEKHEAISLSIGTLER